MSEEIVDFESETEQLGASPVAFVDAVINAVNDYSYDGSELMLKQLLKADPKLDPSLLRKAIQQLLTFVQDKLDKYFDKFELYCLTNVLKIPAHVQLPTDLPSKSNPGPSDRQVENLDKEQFELMEKIQLAKKEQAKLKQELTQLDQQDKQLSSLGEWNSMIKQSCKKRGVSQPSEHVNLVLGDLEELSKITNDMNARRQILAGLSETDGNARKRIRVEKEASSAFSN